MTDQQSLDLSKIPDTPQDLKPQRHATKLMAGVAFGGDLNPDPESAAADLRRAGYEVFMMPDKHPLLAHPLDDFIEVTIEVPNDDKIIRAIEDEIDGIVGRYGGTCMEFGPISSDYIPFADLFGDLLPAAPDEYRLPYMR